MHLEWKSNEVLLHSTGNYIQSLGIDHDGRLYEKKNVHICMTGSLCCTEKKGAQQIESWVSRDVRRIKAF